MIPTFTLATERKNSKCVIKVLEVLDGSSANELVGFIEKGIKDRKVVLLDFKETKQIYEFALHVFADAMKKGSLKGKVVQFSGLTLQEVALLRGDGMEIFLGKNCFDLMEQGACVKRSIPVTH